MNLTVDLDTGRLLDSNLQPASALAFRFRDLSSIALRFYSGNAFADPDVAAIALTIKSLGKYDQNPPLVLADAFTKTGSGTTAVWTGTANFDAGAIATALNADSNDANDIASLPAMAEVYYELSTAPQRTPWVNTSIDNSLYSASDTTPTPSPAQGRFTFLPGVTGYTGGGATNLDGLITVGLSLPAYYQTIINARLQSWVVRAKTGGDTFDGLTVIQPTDYDAGTNDVVIAELPLQSEVDAAASAAAAAASETAAAGSATAAAGSANTATTQATNAADSALNASDSADDAAASATTALNAIAGQFLGGIAGNSVPATAPAAGNYYTITAAGTSQSKTWAIGDYAIYEGTSGNWTQLSAAEAFGYLAPAAISAAGNTDIALATGNRSRVANITVSAGSAGYTHTLALLNTAAVAGYELVLRVAMAAGYNPLIDIRNLTSGGTQLATIVGRDLARVVTLRFRFDGTNWFLAGRERNAEVITLDEAATMAGLRYALPYLQCDGATSNRRLQTTGINLAGSDFTVGPIWFQMPSSGPSTPIYPFFASSTATPNPSSPSATAHNLRFGIDGNDDFVITQQGATSSDFRRITFTDARIAYSGQWCQLWIAFTGDSTTEPSVWLYGETAGGLLTGGTPSTGGTVPNWVSSSLISTYLLQCFNWIYGPVIPGAVVNRRYAQADIDAYRKAGRFRYVDAASGSTTALYTSDFSATVDGWDTTVASQVTLTPNTDAIDGIDDWLKVERTAAGSGRCDISHAAPATLVIGGGYLVRATIHNPAGSTFTHFALACGDTEGKAIPGNFFSVPAGTTATLTGVTAATSQLFRIVPVTSAGGAAASYAQGQIYYIKGISVYKSGHLTDPTNGVQPALAVDDASPAGVQWLSVGYNPVTDKTTARIVATVVHSGSSNVQLLGGSVIDTTKKWRIRSVVVTSSAAPTILLGNASGGSQYVGATALGSGDNEITTFASRIISGANLWSNSNGSATLTYTIHLERIG